jgi:peptide/nickel transport system ATP-binding protein
MSLEHLELGASEVAALVGSSGCGKTSLLLGWTGLLPDLDVTGSRRVLGAAWPEANTSPWREMLAGPVTVLLQDAKAALDPLQRIGVQIRTVTGSSVDQCLEALGSLGLSEGKRILESRPHELSGGQAQKVLLAIALLRAPKLLLADEPTASLDGASIDSFVAGVELLRERHGTAILLATHDFTLVEAVGARLFEHHEDAFEAASARSRTWPDWERRECRGVVLRVQGLTKSFGANSVLCDLEMQIAPGEVVAIVGPSGCGKSTLARILTGHLKPDRGRVECASRQKLLFQETGRVQADRPTETGVTDRQLLFQDAFASLTPGRTIRELLEETRVESFDCDREAAAIGLPADSLDRTASELSGGERRRAALLRALSVDPPVLVLDEPTASLDHDSARSVMMMVMNAQRRRRLACLLITHDREMADAFAHRVLELTQGRLQG